jgi:large subunit ribosomal protein L30
LGLSKINDVRELPDTPSVRGLINTVYYLVQVEQ